jgi:hypothetical protein
LKNVWLSFLFLLVFNSTSAQVDIGFGVSGSYNIQSEGWGFGARAQWFIFKPLSLLIQGQYYPSFNQVHEVIGGLELHYAPFYHPIVRPYALAGGSVNYWPNFAESNFDKAKPLDVITEVGGGAVFLDKKWRPFLEFRYNPMYLEGAIHIGIMYFPNFKGRNRYDCPAYM